VLVQALPYKKLRCFAKVCQSWPCHRIVGILNCKTRWSSIHNAGATSKTAGSNLTDRACLTECQEYHPTITATRGHRCQLHAIYQPILSVLLFSLSSLPDSQNIGKILWSLNVTWQTALMSWAIPATTKWQIIWVFLNNCRSSKCCHKLISNCFYVPSVFKLLLMSIHGGRVLKHGPCLSNARAIRLSGYQAIRLSGYLTWWRITNIPINYSNRLLRENVKCSGTVLIFLISQ